MNDLPSLHVVFPDKAPGFSIVPRSMVRLIFWHEFGLLTWTTGMWFLYEPLSFWMSLVFFFFDLNIQDVVSSFGEWIRHVIVLDLAPG